MGNNEKTRILKYIDRRIIKLKKNMKDLPKTTIPTRREVAIRQTRGRILELKSLKKEIHNSTRK